MKKRISVLFLAFVLFFSSSITTYACEENRTKKYVTEMLFGHKASIYENEKNTEILLCGLYLCSEQSNNAGKEKLALLKKEKVRGLPTIEEINVQNNKLYSYSHQSWETIGKSKKNVQSKRKAVLDNTVEKVFDFGWFNEKLNDDQGQVDSFAALLYYTHILSDYLGDNPSNTEVSSKGYRIPAYLGNPSIKLKSNKSGFSTNEKAQNTAFLKFSSFDNLGRTGTAFANIGPETLAPANSREEIGKIKPSGWNQQKYDGIVNSQPPYLFNRCHLIAHQLANVDEANNLITGTRYLNESMRPYEEEVAKYVMKTGNHVLYRATPVYLGDNLVASGIHLEAFSVEDNGEGIDFNIFLYNVQPGIEINYSTGKSEQSDTTYHVDNIIEFAVANPNDNNPDLIYELTKHLQTLFEGQQKTNTYKLLMSEIKRIGIDARAVGSKGEKEFQKYQKYKKYQYELMNTMITHVPRLLAKEEFFKSAFKN